GTCTTRLDRLRVPFRMGHVPPGARAVKGCANGGGASVVFALPDVKSGYGEIRWGPHPHTAGDPSPNFTVDGHPALLGPSSTSIHLGDCVLIVDGFVVPTDMNRYVAAGLTLATNCDDQSTWFPASALPHG